MTAWVGSIKRMFHLTYPKSEAKIPGLVAESSKIAILALNALQWAGCLTVPYAGWVQIGLGTISLLSQVWGGTHRVKLSFAKELVEIVPLLVLGACNACNVLSVSKMAAGSLISISLTSGVYWVLTPLAITYVPSVAGRVAAICGDHWAADTKSRLEAYDDLETADEDREPLLEKT